MEAGSTPVLVHNFNAECELAKLPKWEGKGQTEGRWAAPGRDVEGIKSGDRFTDPMAKDSRQYLQDALATPEARPIPGNYDHIEQKLITRMFDKQDPLDEVDVVINHTGGPCSDRLGCSDVANKLLYGSGKVMRVHWSDDAWEVMNCVEYGIVNGGSRC